MFSIRKLKWRQPNRYSDPIPYFLAFKYEILETNLPKSKRIRLEYLFVFFHFFFAALVGRETRTPRERPSAVTF